MSRYRVVLRACDAVLSANGQPRPDGLTKSQVIEACFASLVGALATVPHDVVVIGDRLSSETESFFRGTGVDLVNEELGNEGSLARSLDYAYSFADDDWVYLCEDDYLHARHALRWIDDLIENREEILATTPRTPAQADRTTEGIPLFIHPPDYPDRYLPSQRRPSLIFLSRYCHWRQVSNTTFTFLTEVKTLRTFRRQVEGAVRWANDDELSRLVYARGAESGRALCVSPIPGVATHLHEGTMTPLVDWDLPDGANGR